MLSVTLKAVQTKPGTANEIADRTNQNRAGVTAELLTLHERGKISRVKTDTGGRRAVYVYSVADEAASQA